ncbi:PEP-CTERM sorting domain-containing protein [Roseateles sp.]|uniref:PEP-CTERM sorting domain-containing protein n=1 Tax=Roseateles sp. TaxID=1971397 RepID=UPI0025D6F5D5|nr:PEP-CTERM sorting domain-containing protein [Roseateles sp.]MBV8035043.1 hypothetical protein [Roseateles sp.]
MRTMSKLLALALTATLQSAMAGTVFLDFEDLTTTAPLAGSYHGVNISGAAWGATSEACTYGPSHDPGDISFIRTGSCGALLLAQDPTRPSTNNPKSLTLSIAGGFIDSLSFVYSGRVTIPNLAVHVFDDLGKELGLGLTGLTAAGCSGFAFCNWSETVTLNFTGVAHSVVFSADDQAILLDDLRFTTPAVNPGQLPEPGSVALAMSALGALGWARRRTRR